jgi:UDP-glucose 4-epimerase
MGQVSQERAAVVGAAGFIGAALTRRLRQSGIEVAAYTRASPFVSPGNNLDLGMDGARTIYWLASSIRPSTAAHRPDAVDADRTALADLIARMRAVGHQARLVTVSSGGTVYDTSQPAPYHEQSLIHPTNEYGRAMLEIERTAATWKDSVVLRVSNAYGPGQRARQGQGVIAHWLSAVEDCLPVHVMGDDQVARDYVFIEDVVDALIAVGRLEEPTPILNIGSGRPTSLAELLDLVCSVVRPRRVEVIRDPSRTFDSPTTWLNVNLAGEQIGWTPRTPLLAGLSATWSWMLDQPSEASQE